MSVKYPMSKRGEVRWEVRCGSGMVDMMRVRWDVKWLM